MNLFIELAEALAPVGYKIVSYESATNKDYRFEASLIVSKTKIKASLPHEVAKIFAVTGYKVISFSICDQGLKFMITPDC